MQPLEQIFAAQLTGGGLCPNCGRWGKQHHARRCYLKPPLIEQLAGRFKCWRARKRVAAAVARYLADIQAPPPPNRTHDPVEVMARAICARQLYMSAWDRLNDGAQESYRAAARSALAAAESAGMVMVPKVPTEAMRAAIDGDTPYVSRRNKTYDDGRIYEVIRMDNANWRTTITDDQTVMGRFPNSQEADALCAKLAFEFHYAAMIEAATAPADAE